MKFAALILALSLLLVAGCQKENPGGSETTPPSGGNPTTGTASAPDVNITPAVSYSKVQEAFTKNCILCHGDKNPKEGINLTSYAKVMKGGEHGPILTAGDPDNSLIVHVLEKSHGKPQMPPAGPLPPDQIQLVKDWIK